MSVPGEAGPEAAQAAPRSFSAAEIGAIAHLYRAEIYRSTVWRTRLDSTTNWAVVTTGIALSATFWMVFAYVTLRLDQHAWRVRQSLIAVG
jgi:uncharacterized membrane protein